MFLRPRWLVSALALLAIGETSTTKTKSNLIEPISLLREKGITSDHLNEISVGLKAGDECSCALACDVLASIFGNNIVDVPGQESYQASQSRFWTQQQSQETKPKCFVHPADAEDVSVIILVSRATECPFAVKGGGHSAFKGASNSRGGITIDFIHRKHVVPSSDRSSVAIGPGNTWREVYTALENFNLTMVGGRAATVGVSGLLLGGGISFFSGEHGWACDNIISYEIVLGSGEILTVDSNTNPDLFWALRGGGGNFGIVTQFVANAFDQGPMWGGFRAWETHSTRAAITDALISYAKSGSEEDPKAALIVSFSWAQSYQMWLSSVMVDHPDPQPIDSHPQVFDDFFKIENAVMDTTRTTSHSNLTIEITNTSPAGLRQSYWAITTHLDKQLATEILDIFMEEVKPIETIAGSLPSLVYQIITVSQLKAMTRKGDNALGIGGGKRPLLLINLTMMWMLASDDKAVLTAFNNIYSRVQKLAQERELDHPFIYMNYASQFQDPIGSYGKDNKDRLLKISKKYDPAGVFQKLNPGYFKFEGAPAEW
ncbi:FAD-binding domain-containing protein [Hypomontagnella submonticulosa]|nr:FAD-binding domain-containing protein [Hypomontagnella submonticulosa]